MAPRLYTVPVPLGGFKLARLRPPQLLDRLNEPERPFRFHFTLLPLLSFLPFFHCWPAKKKELPGRWYGEHSSQQFLGVRTCNTSCLMRVVGGEYCSIRCSMQCRRFLYCSIHASSLQIKRCFVNMHYYCKKKRKKLDCLQLVGSMLVWCTHHF